MSPTRFTGQVAVVTGGASGIGAATVRRLATEGALVAVADLDSDGSKLVAAEVDGLAVPLDVTDMESVVAGMAAVDRDLGPIDVLVNNAGGDTWPAFFIDSAPEDWDRALTVNLRGTMACTHVVLPGMQFRGRGAIVNMASEAGRAGLGGAATYSAAKAGVLGFTKAIAREGARHGIRCNAVAPGPVETPMLEELEKSGLGARVRAAMVAGTMLGRCGTPDEIAAAVAFLASDDASYITGHTLSVSGGGYVA